LLAEGVMVPRIERRPGDAQQEEQETHSKKRRRRTARRQGDAQQEDQKMHLCTLLPEQVHLMC